MPNNARIAVPMVSTKNRASVSAKVCDQGFNISPDPPRVFFVQRIGRRPRA